MHRSIVRTGIAAAIASVLLQLGGCGSGSGDSGTSSSSTAPATTTSIGGTVAAGSALVGASVTLIDATGAQVTTTTGAQGAYSLSVKGLTLPFFIIAQDAGGLAAPLSSVVARLPTGSAPAVANVTTLTTALAATLTASGNPIELASNTTLAKVTLQSVQLATITLDTIITNLLTQNGLQTAGFDPIGTAFTPDHTGADAVIDSLSLVTGANGGRTLVSNAAPGTTVALNNTTAQGVALAASPTAANYLEPLAALLTACAANGALNSAACAPAIDASFKESGSTDLATAHGLSETTMTGAVFGSPKTLAFFTRNGKQLALVQLPFTLASGVPGVLYSIAQPLATPVTLAGGTQLGWDLIGDQSSFAVAIRSHLQRRTYLDTRLNDVNRYEAGLDITIPTASNPNVYSASVTGPGLAAPVWLMPRAASGNSTLGLADSALSAPPLTPATTASNTALYRWSWQSRSSTASFTPPTSTGFYAAQALDASTVPLYSTYMVTFYDKNGAQLGQSSVINPGSPLNAAAGDSIPWPTLLMNDATTQFLTPGTTLADAQYALSVTWSGLVNDGLNLAYPVTSPGIAATASASGSVTQVNGFAVGAANNPTAGQYQATISAGVDSAGVQTCTNCPFPALTSGGSRLIQLGGARDGTAYIDITQYND
ncbi:carboxypeptidase-like regulatory domain-containing protein [Paraburkholderia antibiotica]|uniref:Carboxypeptidase regulatory-like domain-containing protein n=1 Tax=Paraburkholderia antibiotica TaxID=2728839 RepID=A0A7Y0FFZ5_9BURK|nr:carboxypeptidase-like regulatory domain-containing protein [Paraburkholderia antibiotica]NML34681.1 carboxypeptidase regulatory-like domain-containing protein [Paraburkholderia antibiotica]